MTPDLDTLLIALYVEIDDHIIPPGECRPGQPKRLSDGELMCLAAAQMLPGARSEVQLDLERHGGRTTGGLYTRITQRLLAMAVCIWHNWATGTSIKRSLISYDN